MYNSEKFTDVEVTDAFTQALNDEKVSNKQIGLAASLEVGDKIVLSKLDYFDNKQKADESEYAKLKPAQKRRYVKLDDGLYEVDNSYFGSHCTLESKVNRVSFSSLVGYNSFQTRLTDAEKKTLSEKINGKTIVNIKPGSSDFVAEQVVPYMGKTLEVVYKRAWNAGDKMGNNVVTDYNQKMLVFAVADGTTKGGKKSNK